MSHENMNQREAGVTILISNNIGFIAKKIITIIEEYYIMLKEVIYLNSPGPKKQL